MGCAFQNISDDDDDFADDDTGRRAAIHKHAINVRFSSRCPEA